MATHHYYKIVYSYVTINKIGTENDPTKPGPCTEIDKSFEQQMPHELFDFASVAKSEVHSKIVWAHNKIVRENHGVHPILFLR